jgi:imidazole glycerol-phosphate synthase subunit HisH
VIVPTGTANTASVLAAFGRLGADLEEVADPSKVATAGGLVVPGVGSFGAALANLERPGMRDALRDRIEAGRPTLAVCVGMQLLCSSSAESPGAVGLGVIDRIVERFPGNLTVPQLGWNLVDAPLGSGFIEPGWAYFANSYRIESAPAGWVASYADYGGRFVAAVERGAVLALQFHPELSGAWGAALLGRWLSGVAA